MAQDKAYKRALVKAITPLVKSVVIRTNKGHLAADLVLPDDRKITLPIAGSPTDHHTSVKEMVRNVRRYINGTYS